MSQINLVSIVMLLGWLVLVLSAYQARRISARQTVVMALAWAAIFMFVALVFTLVR